MFTHEPEIEQLCTQMLAIRYSSTMQLASLKVQVMTCFAKAEAAMGCAMGPQEPLQYPQEPLQYSMILTEFYQTLNCLVASWRSEITSGLPIQS